MPNEFIVKNGLISQGNITISGSITATGGVTVSGSIASASYAFNAELLDGLDSTVFTLTSSFNAQTASFTAFTSSMNSFSASILTNVTALNAKTASFATTGSNTFVGAEVISGSLAISGSGTPFTLNTDTLEITGSLLVTGSTTLTGSLLQLGNFTTTGTIIAQTINVQTVTSSIVYSSGSNVFGNSLGNSQTFTGSVLITGSLTIAGASSATSYNGATIFGSTIACSPIGCFATSCATSFIGGTMSGTTIYGSTAVCSAVGKFTTCIDAGSGTFSSGVTAIGGVYVGSGTAGRNAFSQSDFRIAAPNDTNILNGIAANASMTIKSDYYGGGSATPLILQSGANTNQLYLATGGGVGIGAGSPDAALHICCSAGSANALLAHFQNSGGGTAIATIKIGEGIPEGQYGVLGHYGVDNSFRIGSVNGNLSFHAGASTACGTNLYGMCERLTILTSGNVGIGRTDPTRLLDVSALGTAYIRASDRTNSVNVDMLAASSGGWIGTQTTHAFMIQTDNTERMRITSGGNVGIGVTPSAWDTLTPLQIKNVAFAGYTSGNTHVLYAASNFYYCGGDKYITNGFASLYSQADGNHVWYNASCNSSGAGATLTFCERMRISCNGKIEMGSSTSSSGLSIYSNQTALTIRGSTGYDRGFLAFSWDVTPDIGTMFGCSLGFNTNATVGTNAGTRALTIASTGTATFASSIISSAGIYNSEKTVTISALCTSVLIFSGAPSGIISARDNTNGGSGLWLQDPNGNGGTGTLVAYNWINGVYTVFYSGGNTYVQKTSGNVPITFHYVIYGN